MKTLLKQFFFAATPTEAKELAAATWSTVGYLRSHVGVHRNASEELAVRIERATWAISAANAGQTPVVSAHDLRAEWQRRQSDRATS